MLIEKKEKSKIKNIKKSCFRTLNFFPFYCSLNGSALIVDMNQMEKTLDK